MIAIPSGASGIGISQRWIRNRSPGNHSKVTRAPTSAGGMSLKVATSLHSPTNGSRASSESPLLVLAAIAFLLLHEIRYHDIHPPLPQIIRTRNHGSESHPNYAQRDGAALRQHPKLHQVGSISGHI